MRKKGDSELTTALLGSHLIHIYTMSKQKSVLLKAAIRDVQRKFPGRLTIKTTMTYLSNHRFLSFASLFTPASVSSF